MQFDDSVKRGTAERIVCTTDSIEDPAQRVVITMTIAGVITSVSSSVQEVSGYRPEELVGRLMYEVIYPEDHQAVMRVHDELRKTGGVLVGVLRLRSKDNNEVWFEWTVASSRDRATLHAVGRDVTAQQFKDRLLQASERRYKALFYDHPEALFSLDSDGYFVAVNPAYETLTGYTSQELAGLRPEDILPAPEERERCAARLGRMLTDVPFVDEAPIITKTGEHRIVLLTSRTLRSEGIIMGIYGSMKDITEIKRQQAALKASEQRYKALFYDHPVALFTVDRHGRITSVNSALEALTGYSAEELKGQSPVLKIVPEQRDDAEAGVANSLRGIPVHAVREIITKAGERRVMILHTRTLTDENGNVEICGALQESTGITPAE